MKKVIVIFALIASFANAGCYVIDDETMICDGKVVWIWK